MIVYDLICAHQHRFEGWFASTEDFARQRDETMIRCPVCDDGAIERRPSANIQVGRAIAPAAERQEAAASPSPPPASEVTEAQVIAALKLFRHLVASTENVGPAFPEEARKIHYDEVPKRGIRGQASPEEAEELREEGIEFMSVPAFLSRDLN